ncbi:hypothetical protein ANCCAN_28979 [Ancylostoma caninum]|uniref:Uncharacterized protein n=1 Tax=Ancylostoma caninum TaxID=29170 RepID=A0A368F2R9_ANCCA|nr:hypothetical protein ANCCAN_28979 [Ancylostoma caninum]
MFALRLQGDITCAKVSKMERNFNFTEIAAIPSTKPQLSTQNCVKKWWIEESPPFVKLDLAKVALKWQPRKKDNTYQQLTALYRFILQRITAPPQKIKEFAVRLNQGSGRDENLKNLPELVEQTLVGFGEDMMGYGHEDISSTSTNSCDTR